MRRSHQLADLLTPGDVTVVHHPNWPHPAPRGETGLIELDRDTLDSMDSYDTSTPTAPSPGRVYKKRHFTTRAVWLDRWTVFICEADPVDPSCTYHHPHEVLLRGAS